MNKSISFNEEMLKAILDGRKTQTRRPHAEAKYQVGDTVYVKEPWKIKQWYQEDGDLDIEYISNGQIKHKSIPFEEDDSGEIFNEYWIESCDDYITAGVPFNEEYERYETPEINPCRLRSAKEMPDYFSRLSIKITSVRKEKLHDITEQDAIAEGLIKVREGRFVMDKDDIPNGMWFPNHISCFSCLWGLFTTKMNKNNGKPTLGYEFMSLR